MEAQLIKGMLDGYNIPCILRSNAAGSVHSFVFDGMGIRVLVPEAYAEKRRILSTRSITCAQNHEDDDLPDS